ncbi:terminase small subunit [Heyndrickxia oleronia]|uniref:terminase small subunit n=1 Tax=Heyndrickxia oleronia TaxID=38875 RepID=UPI001B27AF1F|nr:terminase small subunit [Heyndrickxia oleronia]GIN38387.1 terminase small subunit [Heyndrickxia oleronia]
MKLTEKQKRFADYYIETGNASEAYKRAYDCTNDTTARTNGNKNLQKPTIRSYIDEQISKKDASRIAKQDEVLEYLTSIMRGEHQEQTLRGVGEGAQVISDIDVSAKDRIKAAELLGKRYAMWTDNKNIGGNIGVTIVDDIDD